MQEWVLSCSSADLLVLYTRSFLTTSWADNVSPLFLFCQYVHWNIGIRKRFTVHGERCWGHLFTKTFQKNNFFCKIFQFLDIISKIISNFAPPNRWRFFSRKWWGRHFGIAFLLKFLLLETWEISKRIYW